MANSAKHGGALMYAWPTSSAVPYIESPSFSLLRNATVTATADAASSAQRHRRHSSSSSCGGLVTSLLFFLVRVPGSSPCECVVGAEHHRRGKRQGRGGGRKGGVTNSYASGDPSPSTSPPLGWGRWQGWRFSERGGGVAEKRKEASDGVGDGHPVEDALAVRVQRPKKQPACGTII